MQVICFACKDTFTLRGVGQYLCDNCHTDPLSKTARSTLAAGGFTLAPLQHSSGAAKDTSTPTEMA